MVDYSYSVISYSSQICKISKMEQESQKHSTKKNFQNATLNMLFTLGLKICKVKL